MDDQILLRVNQGEYVGGDTIYGTVYVRLNGAVPSRTLRLYIRGFETSGYDYSYTVPGREEGEYETKKGHRNDEKTFLKEDYKMIEYPRGFPKGTFSFPFQYQLPHGVPGVFNIKADESNTMEGNVRYIIGAILTNPSPRPKLQAETPLIIYDTIDCRNAHYQPSKQVTTDKVQYLVCFPRGSVNLTTRLDKSAYSSDENIIVSVNVDNQSSLDIISITFTLNRVLRFFGKDNERDELELTDQIDFVSLITQQHGMIAQGTQESWEQILNLKEVPKLPPTTSGSIVRCQYHIDIKLYCQYSLDIDQVQHVVIKPQGNITWEKWECPEWINECTVGPVTGPISVTRDLLSSVSFANVPGLSTSTKLRTIQQ